MFHHSSKRLRFGSKCCRIVHTELQKELNRQIQASDLLFIGQSTNFQHILTSLLLNQNSCIIVVKSFEFDWIDSETDLLLQPSKLSLPPPSHYFKGLLPQVRHRTVSLLSDSDSEDESPSIKSITSSGLIRQFIQTLTVSSINSNNL